MSTSIFTQNIELLTPALLAGAYQKEPEWRGASLHGQLHFWARMLAHDGRPEQMRQNETRLMGGVGARSSSPTAGPFAAWITGDPVTSAREYAGCPHDRNKGRRHGIPAGATARLCWMRRTSQSWLGLSGSKEAALEADFKRVLRAWLLLGSIGLRQNRAAGSVWLPEWSPAVGSFRDEVSRLQLPSAVSVYVLSAPEDDNLDEEENSERLRKIATDTIKLAPGEVPGNPLGYARGQERKASALKLKVGRFADGLRLIAVHDQRDGRGGSFAQILDVLRNKPLGRMLQQGTLVTAEADVNGSQPIVSGSAPKTGISAVEALLSGKFDFTAFARYRDQVSKWSEAGEHALVAEFIRRTQEPRYAGLRSQDWYVKFARATPC